MSVYVDEHNGIEVYDVCKYIAGMFESLAATALRQGTAETFIGSIEIVHNTDREQVGMVTFRPDQQGGKKS